MKDSVMRYFAEAKKVTSKFTASVKNLWRKIRNKSGIDTKNFGTLYMFELKKIMKNRLTIAMIIITFIVVMITVIAPGMSVYREMRQARMEHDGRLIDDSLLDEMYPNIDTYGEKWNEDNEEYYNIAYVVQCIADYHTPLAEYSAEDLYRKREENIYLSMKRSGLSEKELEWWANNKVETPFRYYYDGGAIYLAQGLTGALTCILLMAALCLSTVFTTEHRQRTDQILLSCINGRQCTYAAKIAAGISLILGCSAVASGSLSLLILTIYGHKGLRAAVQLPFPLSAYPLTMGQFILIQLSIMLTAGILFAVFAVAASELLKNSLAVTGIMVGLFIFARIDIVPAKYRFLSQAKAMLPTNLIDMWSLREHRLIDLGGHMITQYAASPIIYLTVSVVLIIAGWAVYNRFQVTGR